MANQTINAYCRICGEGYHVCNSCRDQLSLKPWRAITDTVEHYKIYLALHRFNLTGDKEKAKQDLAQCDLSDMDKFKDTIKDRIKAITKEDKPKTTAKIKTKKKTAEKKNEVESTEATDTDSELENNVGYTTTVE